MKKMLIIFLFLVCTTNLFAQDKEPSPVPFKWDGTQTPRPFDPDAFKQTQFFTGFQWGSTYNMENVLMNNAVALGTYNIIFKLKVHIHRFVKREQLIDTRGDSRMRGNDISEF